MKSHFTFVEPHTFSRGPVLGLRSAISTGHYLSTLAGSEVLLNGGNAIDAGVAAGLCLNVVRPDYVSFAGCAPLLIYRAKDKKPVSVCGVGPWPMRASRDLLLENSKDGTMPDGILRTVVPACPHTWIEVLGSFGTLSFEKVSRRAFELAEDGFPMYRTMADNLREKQEGIKRFRTTADVLLPGGAAPKIGEKFVQRDLAGVIRRMVNAERKARSRGRLAGLQAARDAFYVGPIARKIASFFRERGGFLAADDLARFLPKVEAPVSVRYKDFTLYMCPPWSQGPILLQALKLLETSDLRKLGHNSGPYLHLVAEALKLAFADRERYYGDPDFVRVPLKTLLSKPYMQARRKMLGERAWPTMPPFGNVKPPYEAGATDGAARKPADSSVDMMGGGTDHVSVIDREGNAFVCTPSDLSTDTEIVPGTGLAISSRGSQSRLGIDHPNVMAPGKRPCVTLSPAMVFRKNRLFMAFGTPGGDTQVQTMLQVLLNVIEFRMEPQAAVEAPRIITQSFPAAFSPHAYSPGLLKAESRIDEATQAELSDRGHKVQTIADWAREAGGVCAVVVDPSNGALRAAADPRRESSGSAW